MSRMSVKEIDQSEAAGEMNREVDPQTGRCILKWTIRFESGQSGSMFWHNLAFVQPRTCSTSASTAYCLWFWVLRHWLPLYYSILPTLVQYIQVSLLFEFFVGIFSFRSKLQQSFSFHTGLHLYQSPTLSVVMQTPHTTPVPYFLSSLRFYRFLCGLPLPRFSEYRPIC